MRLYRARTEGVFMPSLAPLMQIITNPISPPTYPPFLYLRNHLGDPLTKSGIIPDWLIIGILDPFHPPYTTVAHDPIIPRVQSNAPRPRLGIFFNI